MPLALARVGEIRTEIASLQDLAAARTRPASSATTATGGATTAADFASVLSAVSGVSSSAGSDDLLPSRWSPASGTSADDALRLLEAFAGTTTARGGPAVPGAPGAATGAVPAGTSAGGPAGAAVVETARTYLGVPYVWGGESLAEGGLDCSGLVQLVYAAHGVDLPRVARDQMHAGTEIASLAQARPGDLVVQRGGAHIGIYVGDGQMIHAPRPGRTVEITPVTDDSVTTIRRVVG